MDRPTPTHEPAARAGHPAAAGREATRLAAARLAHELVRQVTLALSAPRETVELSVLTLLAGGHLLLEDVPGTGKTTLARALARCVSGSLRRVQFTPDMLPSDLTGVSVFDQRTNEFTFHPGPLFANVVIADEVNRANPRTQAAMLEAMGEGRVTVDGTTYALPSPYFLIATQNPVEMEGTYPLPEAQLDRFMCRASLGYPSEDSEVARLMTRGGTDPVERLRPLCGPDDLLAAQGSCAQAYVAEAVARYARALLEATRTSDAVALGASPRAGLGLLQMARAHALLDGRDAVWPSDVRAVAGPALAHRVRFAEGGGRMPMARALELLDDVLSGVPAPRG